LIQFEGLVWLLALIGILVFTQRQLHRQIQTTFLLITRQPETTIALFSIVFLPVIALHEFSHWLTAKLLGVRTGHFSVAPQRMPDGKLRLGYVETAETDIFREALIGAAPLIAGGIFIAYAGYIHFKGAEIQQNMPLLSWNNVGEVAQQIYRQPDFWIWFYLTLAISSTMFPSSSDRRTWLPVGLATLLLIGIVFLAGAGPWLKENLSPMINSLIWSVVFVMGISFLVQLLLLIPFFLVSRILMKVTGLQVV
jgi:hypothetical protein